MGITKKTIQQYKLNQQLKSGKKGFAQFKKTSFKFTTKELMKKNSVYFCICDNCGSISWLDIDDDDNPAYNRLLLDGETYIKKNALDMMRYYVRRNALTPRRTTANLSKAVQGQGYIYFCSECEKPLHPISCKSISLTLRKKIARMKTNERKDWAKNYSMVKELE